MPGTPYWQPVGESPHGGNGPHSPAGGHASHSGHAMSGVKLHTAMSQRAAYQSDLEATTRL